MLSKIRQKSIYHAIFESYLSYTSLVWTQNSSSVKRLHILQKKSLRLMIFQSRNAHTDPLLKCSKILQFSDKVALENCILISKSLHYQKSFVTVSLYPSNLTHTVHDGEAMFVYVCSSHRIKFCGRYSVTINAIYTWRFWQTQSQGTLPCLLRTKQLKDLIFKYIHLTSFSFTFCCYWIRYACIFSGLKINKVRTYLF